MARPGRARIQGALGGPRRLIALINDGLVVRKILAHLGFSTEPPPLAPARAPPEPEFAW